MFAIVPPDKLSSVRPPEARERRHVDSRDQYRFGEKLTADDVEPLPRWAKAFIAARMARRAIETLDGRQLDPGFHRVLETLNLIESAIENGLELQWPMRDFSRARQYADSISRIPHREHEASAALAVDDAFALVTQEGRLGRQGLGSPTDFQIRKLAFTRGCAVSAAHDNNTAARLANSFEKDIERVIAAIRYGMGWHDTRPVPADLLAQHCEFDIALPVQGHSIVDLRGAINDELIARIHESPILLYEIHPRKFEELIARVFEAFGFEVELTAPIKDGGRDIIAISNVPTKLKFLIECKRYARENKVGIDIVQRLHGVVMGESATAGIIATTSTFTEPANEFLKRPAVEYKLSGCDFDGLRAWLSDWERTQRVRGIIGTGFTITANGLVFPNR